MKYRIVEFKPGKYKAQRLFPPFWVTIIKASFVAIEDAEKAIERHRVNVKKRREDWYFIQRVVKWL